MSYFVHNPHITAERLYAPLLRHVLTAFAGEPILLILDTSMLWNQFCLTEVCCVWSGRSFTVAQTMIEQVSFEDYQTVLECAKRLLPSGAQVTLLANRGFEHAALLRWLQKQQWLWAIRGKSDLNVTLANRHIYDTCLGVI